MGSYALFAAICLAVIYTTSAQYPPQRLQIPGAVLLQTPPRARTRIQYPQDQQLPRLRRPISNAFPAPAPAPVQREQIRPVNEEPQEPEPQRQSILDDEVSKLSQSFQPAVSQNIDDQPEPPKPVPFRPERPIPILRESIRESKPTPISRPAPVLRQEVPQARPVPRPVVRQEPISRPPPRPIIRNYDDDEEENIPIRRPAAQPVRQRAQPAPRPVAQYSENQRDKKPTVQILRKFRNDNEDGSITWGYENEDGTFKEETLGADCITRGKYGYVDPDGVRREFSYETGSKCEEELPDEEELLPQIPHKGNRKPQPQQLPQQQYTRGF